MPKSPTLYEVLGLPRDADEAAVRAAYRGLMKRYHPDRARDGNDEIDSNAEDREESGRDGRASELNAAFAVLRDPGRRARYDAELRFHDARGEGLPPRDAALAGRVVGNPHSRSATVGIGYVRPAWQGVYAGVTLMVVTLGAIWAGLLVRADHSTGTAAARMVSTPGLGPAPVPIDPALADAGRAEFARVFAQSGLGGAAAYSDLCFEEQARTRRADDLDFCIAFDRAAFARANASVAGDLPKPDQFDAAVIEQRHAAALSLVARERSAAISADTALIGVDALGSAASSNASAAVDVVVPVTPPPPPRAAPAPSAPRTTPSRSADRAATRATVTAARVPRARPPAPRRAVPVQPRAVVPRPAPRPRPVRRATPSRPAPEPPRDFTIGPQ